MIEIDEHYVGTFHIEKNMSIDVPYKHEWIPKDWLSCCIVGCGDPCDYGPYYNPCTYDCLRLTSAANKTASSVIEAVAYDPTTIGGCCS